MNGHYLLPRYPLNIIFILGSMHRTRLTVFLPRLFYFYPAAVALFGAQRCLHIILGLQEPSQTTRLLFAEHLLDKLNSLSFLYALEFFLNPCSVQRLYRLAST